MITARPTCTGQDTEFPRPCLKSWHLSGVISSDAPCPILLAVFFIAMFALLSAGATGLAGRFLACRLMLWGGEVSYSACITHFILLLVIRKLLPWQRFEAMPPSLALIVFGPTTRSWSLLVQFSSISLRSQGEFWLPNRGLLATRQYPQRPSCPQSRT